MYIFSIAYKYIAFSCVVVSSDGSQCNSVLGLANITVPSCIASIAVEDAIISGLMEQFAAMNDQDCHDYSLFIWCITNYAPCPGSAWCGANSRDELRSAVTSARSSNTDDSCTDDPNEAMVTVVDVLISAINTSLPDYYVGNSSTGPVGDSTAVCQEVFCTWFKHAGVALLQEFAGMYTCYAARMKWFMYKVNTSTVQWVLCLLLVHPMMGAMLPVLAVVKQVQVQVQLYVHDVCADVCVCCKLNL